MSVERLFTVSSRFTAAARADREGSVQAMQGEFDAETVCAAVAMARTSVGDIAELLGLGEVASWAASGPNTTVYVVSDGEGFYTVVGESEKNPEGLLKKLVDSA
jgi:predicted regulator of Ras-like GTPase activity (Roadblock/LC7/MglB family)